MFHHLGCSIAYNSLLSFLSVLVEGRLSLPQGLFISPGVFRGGDFGRRDFSMQYGGEGVFGVTHLI